MTTKLRKLAEIEGYETVTEMMLEVMTDSICPGICTHKECDYAVEVEPDQDRGWCEECRAGTVKSALVLGGLI